MCINNMYSLALSIEIFRHMLINGSQPPEYTPPSPQPSQAWHGYRATNAHHEDVGVSADGHPSAPHPGQPPLYRRRAHYPEYPWRHVHCG
jgi:hypothetical protein